jgi:hypothetical protein
MTKMTVFTVAYSFGLSIGIHAPKRVPHIVYPLPDLSGYIRWRQSFASFGEYAQYLRPSLPDAILFGITK